MKISLREFQKVRYKYLSSQLENKNWKEGIWWTGTPTSLMGFYGMNETVSRRELNRETYEIHTPLGLRVTGKERAKRLLPFFAKPENENFYRNDPIFEAVVANGKITNSDLISQGIQPRTITKTISELKRDWIVIVERKGKERIYHHWKSLIEEKKEEDLENILLDMFNVFGLMTIDGISLLLGIRPYYFINILTAMEREGVLYRPFRLIEGKKDVFGLIDALNPENLIERPVMDRVVLEDTDALASLILLEEGKTLGKKAILLLKGIPHAFFQLNLKRKKLSIRELEWLSGSVEEAQEGIKTWGERMGFVAEIDYRNSKLGKFTIDTLNRLLERGYKKIKGSLELKKENLHHIGGENYTSRTLGFNWVLRKQFLTFKSEREIIEQVIQLNSLDCLALRLGRTPNMDGVEARIGRGGNGRVGIMALRTFQAFSNVDQKEIDYTLADKKILETLNSYPGLTASELSSQVNLPFSKVIQRLRFLERRYRVARLGNRQFDDTEANWEINHLLGTMDSETARSYLITKLLEGQMPLTTTMISRFFGWDFRSIEKTLESLEQEGKIERGHFIRYPGKEEQFSFRGRIDEIIKEETIEEKLYFVPFGDPLAIIYFPLVMELFPALQPRSLAELENGLIVFKGPEPIGYISKTNVNHLGQFGKRIGYVANLRIRREWLNFDEVIGIFHELISEYYEIWQQWGAIGWINGKSIRTLFGEEGIVEMEGRELDVEIT